MPIAVYRTFTQLEICLNRILLWINNAGWSLYIFLLHMPKYFIVREVFNELSRLMLGQGIGVCYLHTLCLFTVSHMCSICVLVRSK